MFVIISFTNERHEITTNEFFTKISLANRVFIAVWIVILKFIKIDFYENKWEYFSQKQIFRIFEKQGTISSREKFGNCFP